ncbi:hypothetical protein U3516DRAFT_840961 [Neocallimastix sp. 'constans']
MESSEIEDYECSLTNHYNEIGQNIKAYVTILNNSFKELNNVKCVISSESYFNIYTFIINSIQINEVIVVKEVNLTIYDKYLNLDNYNVSYDNIKLINESQDRILSSYLLDVFQILLEILKNLYLMHLDNNYLDGFILESIGELKKLMGLYLNNNSLKGSIPDSIGKSENILQLWLNHNQLHGEVPSTMGKLKNLNLTFRCLDINQLNGIGNLQNLEQLWINNNFLHGDILKSIRSLNIRKYSSNII